jgi:hypothetical protein
MAGNKNNKNNKGQKNKGGNGQKKAPKQGPPKKFAAKKTSGGKITTAGKILRGAGSVAGTFLGNASLGRTAGAAISKIFGQGDYQVRSNSLMSGGPPAFASMNTGMRMAHREYIADVVSSTGFANTTYDVNVIKNTTFPWLSRIAQNFEEYTIKGIVFYFNTTCGSAVSSTNNALGTVGLVTVYDPSDPPLSTKRECEDYSGCVAGVPACSLIHPIECKPRSNVLDRLYIQNSTVNSVDDLKFFSHGTLNVFTQGMQAAGITIGELWVSYDVEFYNPRILPVGTFEMAASRHYAQITTPTQYKVLGNSQINFKYGNLAVYYDSNGYIHLPKGSASGYYLVNYWGIYPTGTAPGLTQSVSANLTAQTWCSDSTGNLKATTEPVSGGVKMSLAVLYYKPDSSEGVFRLEMDTATPPTGLVNWDLVISKIPVSALTDIGAVSVFTAPASRSEDFLRQIKSYIDSKFGMLPTPVLKRVLPDATYQFAHEVFDIPVNKDDSPTEIVFE